MGDKITNFSDYKKRENSGNKDIKADEPKDLFATTEINNIEIEDPYSFFTAEEREEFLREQAKNQASKPEEEPEDKEEKPGPRPRRERDYHEDREEDDYDEEDDEDYDEDEEDEEEYEDEEEESSGGITPEFLVRVASIITGVFILTMLVFFVKVKFIDRFLVDPDTQETVVTAIPEGYTLTNDTVTLTADLNLRSVPSSEDSSTIIAIAQKGTTLKRVAVSSDGNWALVEYENTQLYASMKYLSTP
ncbi:hypothetical protein SAMN04487928_11044 [Butyrivibrio proteoclasticus]|uniref:SH3b domain-containing protein n=1 Tax=Butyrivibrio proteoclasticus TaxID=43305 RepID=A0A1I5TV81_9FIRM|nr:SH3 domain-containing protein [Butyrivibrio proteoclasticus]SFP86964.1 hypothetical protein SAMN04487928_11044 [Butyrivibrio proteoclasticus]